jgi:hypothetical protein
LWEFPSRVTRRVHPLPPLRPYLPSVNFVQNTVVTNVSVGSASPLSLNWTLAVSLLLASNSSGCAARLLISMDSKDERQYADVGIQTSPLSPRLVATSSPTNPSASALAEVTLSLPSLDSDFPSLEGSPGREGCIPANKYVYSSDSHTLPLLPSFPSSFGLQRSIPNSRLNASVNRTVSLPDTLYDEDLNLMLSQLMYGSDSEVREQPRVVSMPDSVQLRALRCTTTNTYDHLDSNIPSLEEMASDESTNTDNEDLRSNSSTPSTPGTIVMHSLSSDPYHTPSPPPSSCDSIEFTLEDPAHLPDTFLRGPTSPPMFVPEVSNKTVGLLEDDGGSDDDL